MVLMLERFLLWEQFVKSTYKMNSKKKKKKKSGLDFINTSAAAAGATVSSIVIFAVQSPLPILRRPFPLGAAALASCFPP